MKSFFICLVITTCSVSCHNNHESTADLKGLKNLNWNNKYIVFDEPNRQSIAEMKFYLLMISGNFLDTLTILSIRQDSNIIQGFYKKVPYDQVPALFANMVETKNFNFSTFRFTLNISQVDSLKSIIRRHDLFSLQDSTITNGTDGTTKEIVVYDGEKFCDIYRGYAFEKTVEPGFISSFKEIIRFVSPLY